MQIEPEYQTVPQNGDFRRRFIFVRKDITIGHNELPGNCFHRSGKTCTIRTPGIAWIFELLKLGALFETRSYADPIVQNVIAVDARDFLVTAHVFKRK